jgi:predicted nucleic acid-binding protein
MIVLDASALIDVVLDSPLQPWVIEQITDMPICAPAHQPAEVLSALARLVRAQVLTGAVALDALEEAHLLDQELVEPSMTHLARALARQDRIRVLDGLYVALAEERGVPLVTTDRRLAAARLPVPVLSPPTT